MVKHVHVGINVYIYIWRYLGIAIEMLVLKNYQERGCGGSHRWVDPCHYRAAYHDTYRGCHHPDTSQWDAWLTPGRCCLKSYPEGPSSQYLRTLVPKAIKDVLLGSKSLNIGYLDPLG